MLNLDGNATKTSPSEVTGIDQEELQKRKLKWKRILAILEDEKFFNQEIIDNYYSEYKQYLDGDITPPYVSALTGEFDENYCDFSVFISDKSGKKGLVVEATSMDTEIAFNNVFGTSM